MARFYGKIGYATQEESSPGIWSPVILTYEYYGEVIKIISKIKKTDNLNDDIDIDNKISIIANEFVYNNLMNIVYVDWLGALWKVKSIEVKRPRLTLTIGGLYNE